MSKKKTYPIVQVHTHFSICRDVNDVTDGPALLEEQIKAVQRFIRWHERQFFIGKQMLAQLQKEQETKE